jgi:hypothetical protein
MATVDLVLETKNNDDDYWHLTSMKRVAELD